MDSQEYSALLKSFDFLPKLWIFKSLLYFSSDLIPLLKAFRSFFREYIIAY